MTASASRRPRFARFAMALAVAPLALGLAACNKEGTEDRKSVV